MKRCVLLLTIILTVFLTLAPKHLQSQQVWETLWIKSAYPTPAYSWMLYLFSGLAYDRVRDKLYVVSVKTTNGVPDPEIWIFNPATGETTGKLLIDKNIINSGFSLGMYSVFKIQVASDGSIYACNMVSPPGGTQGNFKVFKWVSPDSMPVMVFSNSLSAHRYGDAFGVIGTRDSTYIFVSGGSTASGLFNNRFVVLKATNTLANNFNVIRTPISSLNGIFSHGLAPTGLLPTDPVWANSIVRVTSLQSQSNPPISIDDVPVSIDRITSGTIRYFQLTDVSRRKFIITCDGKNDDGGDSTKARLIDVSASNAFFLEGEATPPINSQELRYTGGFSNEAQDVDYKLDVNNRLTLFVLMSNNGIGAFRMTYNLPVELVSYRAILVNDNIELRWLVSQETNNFGFEVQRSLDGGKNFERIGFVYGRGTTNEAKEYIYVDPVKDMSIGLSEVSYRLKQIDADGSSQYSQVVQVLLSATPTDVVLGQNYPNPFSGGSFGNPTTTIAYQLTKPGFVSLKMYSSLGEEMMTLVSESKDVGTHLVKADAPVLPSGIYYYRLNALGKTLLKKMVIVK